MSQQYPKWKYHKNEGARIVQHHEADLALGDEWKESPAHFDSDNEPAKKKGKRKSSGEQSPEISEKED